MKNPEPKKYVGQLTLTDQNRVTLETDEGLLFPVPYAIFVALPPEVMMADAVGTYSAYFGHTITMSGYQQGEILYDALVVRSYIPKKDNDDYGDDYWNNRVPKADILFTARKLPGHSQHFSVDVRQMVTINDSVIFNDLTANGLMVNDADCCNDNIFRLYRHSRLKEINPYHYEYDNPQFGCEFFMYPYELRTLNKGDCDDWGIELASYLIMAGVPEWRVRCVVGNTRSGGGHLTVCVLADDLRTWYHLNSTTSWHDVVRQGRGKLEDFPKADDADDKIGIGEVWFSFNNKYAWHAFETHESEENAHKIPWMKNFKFKPRFD